MTVNKIFTTVAAGAALIGALLTTNVADAKEYRSSMHGTPIVMDTLNEFNRKCGVLEQGKDWYVHEFHVDGNNVFMEADEMQYLEEQGLLDDNLANSCNIHFHTIGDRAYVIDAKAAEFNNEINVMRYSTTSVTDLGIEGLAGSYAAALYALQSKESEESDKSEESKNSKYTISDELVRMTGIDRLYHPELEGGEFIDYDKTAWNIMIDTNNKDNPKELAVKKYYDDPAELYFEKLYAITQVLNSLTGRDVFNDSTIYGDNFGNIDYFAKDRDGNGVINKEDITAEDLTKMVYFMTEPHQVNSIAWFDLYDIDDDGFSNVRGQTNQGFVKVKGNPSFTRGITSSNGQLMRSRGSPTTETMVDEDNRYINSNRNREINLHLIDYMFDNHLNIDMWKYGPRLGGREIIGEIIDLADKINEEESIADFDY